MTSPCFSKGLSTLPRGDLSAGRADPARGPDHRPAVHPQGGRGRGGQTAASRSRSRASPVPCSASSACCSTSPTWPMCARWSLRPSMCAAGKVFLRVHREAALHVAEILARRLVAAHRNLDEVRGLPARSTTTACSTTWWTRSTARCSSPRRGEQAQPVIAKPASEKALVSAAWPIWPSRADWPWPGPARPRPPPSRDNRSRPGARRTARSRSRRRPAP